MKDALTSCGGVTGVRVTSMDTIQGLAVSEHAKIKNISKLNNFEFKDDCIKSWRAYGIGKGKDIKVEISTEGNVTKVITLFNFYHLIIQ